MVMVQVLSRRDMLKTSLAAAAGCTLGGALGLGRLSSAYAAVGGGIPPMPTRVLGRTGFEVPIFSLGGQSTIEQPGKLDEAVAIIHRALDLGLNYIDTSHIYGNGISESYIGEVMKERRGEVFLATKSREFSYDGAMRMIEGSLARLRTDHVDLYQHHHVSTDATLDAVLAPDGARKAFEKLHAEGVVKHLGISGHSSRVLRRAIEAVDMDCVLITVNPAHMAMTDAEHLDDFMTTAVDKRVGVIAMKVTGRNQLLRQLPITMEQAMRYTLSFPVATAIIGITEIAQLDENAELARRFRPMTDAEMARLESLRLAAL
jgi:uncharacterized protein